MTQRRRPGPSGIRQREPHRPFLHRVRGPPAPARPSTQRALAVLVVVSAAVIVYFVFRTIRTRRKNKKTRKYGVLDTSIGNMELTPLEQDDEDDDTLFDANQPRR
ncbi:membrane FAM174A [Pelobates cultripes]|uniref:Transmembrane protein 157 n=1 Tax=Pelobates cultripes TaxID=61616 RepID=A0AAD1W941_PELCU|nr:membrane FAM174A [Pelobates cultripes]